MLYRSWWIIALTVFMAVIGALIIAYFTTPIYQAEARFIVSPNPAIISSENSVLNSLNTLDKRSIINTYTEVLKSDRILQETFTNLDLDETLFDAYPYTAVALPDTNIIALSVTGPDPSLIVQIADGIGQSSIAYIEGLYPVYNLLLLDRAVIPDEPIQPQPARSALIALVLGLALGGALAFFRELLRTPIENFLQQSTLDSMSSALNRKTFEDRLQQISRDSIELSLCMVELNGLQRYGGVLPQPALQQILRNVTQSLKNQLRGNDLIGRWDETRFAVLLSGTPGSAAYNTMSRVHSALSEPMKTEVTNESLDLRPKIGIAENQPGKSPEVLVMQAELALKTALNNGKNVSLGN
jgi:diguanylate cyclase (GGDEF)-like protein